MLSVIALNGIFDESIMLSVVKLSVSMLSVIMLSVIMLSVVAPTNWTQLIYKEAIRQVFCYGSKLPI